MKNSWKTFSLNRESILIEVKKKTGNTSLVKIPKVINRIAKNDTVTLKQWENEEIKCNKSQSFMIEN